VIWFIISLLLIGLVAGFIARAVVPGKDSMSIPATIALGIVGSVVGGLILGLLTAGNRDSGFGPAGWIGSIVGAIIALLVYNRFVANRRHA
jgi:uncharacterized membrane protein YeaQ/YmgE (transglycosylase-associated protein family)